MLIQKDNILIIFLKYPEPGRVKTRLAKAIGNDKACTIYKLLAEDVIKNVFPESSQAYDVCILFTPTDKEDEVKDWLKPILHTIQRGTIQCIPQEGTTLGEKMSNAFQRIFQERPYNKGLVIGTDCPGIHARLLGKAFEALKEKDIVIGPCKDGGYYLLGMSRSIPSRSNQGSILDLFIDIDWSTDRVFDQTMKKVYKNALSYHILETLTDIDTIEDLSQMSSKLSLTL